MDWNAATEKNREALKRVLAMLVAMIGQSAIGNRQSGPGRAQTADGPTSDCRLLLPRHLHRAVLRLLRPAEAAARRLIIVAARGVVVARMPVGEPKPTSPQARGVKNTRAKRIASGPPPLTPPRKGEGVVHIALRTAADVPGGRAAEFPSPLRGGVRGGGRRPRELRLSFPLFDPLRRLHHRRTARCGVPRISLPGVGDPFPLPLPPSDDDAIDATRLALRLGAIARVLDDLPREARRFARWRAAAAGAQTKESGAETAGPQAVSPLRVSEGRVGQAAGPGRGHRRRLWPLRHGRPPGLPRRPSHAVHDILDVTHGLAFWVLERPDTS